MWQIPSSVHTVYASCVRVMVTRDDIIANFARIRHPTNTDVPWRSALRSRLKYADTRGRLFRIPAHKQLTRSLVGSVKCPDGLFECLWSK